MVQGKMDPYVVLEVPDGRTYKTPVLDEAGKTPVWNYTIPDQIVFKANSTTGKEEFVIRSMEDDVGKDD